MATPRTLFEKIWDAHLVHAPEGQPALVYVDLHLVHEVTSPQAFEGLRLAGRTARRPDQAVATMDHNVPTINQSLPIADEISARQVETLRQNCEDFGITCFGLGHRYQGIVHIIGPELGLTVPGTVIAGAAPRRRRTRPERNGTAMVILKSGAYPNISDAFLRFYGSNGGKHRVGLRTHALPHHTGAIFSA